VQAAADRNRVGLVYRFECEAIFELGNDVAFAGLATRRLWLLGLFRSQRLTALFVGLVVQFRRACFLQRLVFLLSKHALIPELFQKLIENAGLCKRRWSGEAG
jgi:hypothetical protein